MIFVFLFLTYLILYDSKFIHITTNDPILFLHHLRICCFVVIQLLSQPHGLQHARLSCPSLSPGVCSNPCPLSPWCHPAISSSVSPFSSCPQSFPASGLFQWISSSHQVAKVLELQLQHQFFQWILCWFPLGLTGLISLLSKWLLQHHNSKVTILWHSAIIMV